MGLIPLSAYLIFSVATAIVAHLFITVPVLRKLAEAGNLMLDYKIISSITLFGMYMLLAPFIAYVLLNPISGDSFESGLYNSLKND